MPFLSFRAKLILAMTLVVAGVTGATVFVTQQRVQATYQKLFEKQFQTQIQIFSERRQRKLEVAAKRCDDIAKSVRVIAAMGEDGGSARVYSDIIVQLPEYLKPQDSGAGAAGWQGRPVIRVVDAQGNIIEPDDARFGTFRKAKPDQTTTGARRPEQIRDFMNLSRPLAEALTEQKTGYIELDRSNDGKQLHEIIITPIVDSPTGNEPPVFLGALLLGFPVADFGEKVENGTGKEELLSGIWLGGKVHTSTIPQTAVEEIGATISGMIKEGRHEGTSEKPVVVNGQPHRLFFKLLNPGSPFPPAAQVNLYSMEDAIAEQRNLRTKIVSFGSFALLSGIGFILVISHGFSKPIERLAEATRRIRAGDFAVKVPVRSRDEVGALTSSFNEMAADLALKERYQTVLSQVTDKEVAEQLIHGTIALGGEVRQVSVLFCDIRGFTALTEHMPPAEVITMLNEHMTAMNRIVHEHHGVVDKFVGDLIMAVFGAPKSYGNDALLAAKCALDMITERRRLNADSRHAIEVGIGVASGEVVAGCMGSQDRLNYTVLGERVNLASRLCSKAGGMELLIDDTTCAQLPPGFRVAPTEPLPLKGFSAPMPAYRLTAGHGTALENAAA